MIPSIYPHQATIKALTVAMNVAANENQLDDAELALLVKLASELENPKETPRIVIKRVRLSGAGVTEVARDERAESKRATHLSLYVETKGSPPQWLEDIRIDSLNSGIAFHSAMVSAAKHSMSMQLPIAKFDC